jgi:post-segregation antitoxin (ccd killing protein)
MSTPHNISSVNSGSEGLLDKDEQEKLKRPPSQEAELWLVENRKALDCANEYVRRHGLPLERYRLF